MYPSLCLYHSVVSTCTHLYGSIILWSSLCTHLYACIVLWPSHVPPLYPHHSVVLSCTHLYACIILWYSTHLDGSIILWSSLNTHIYACIILWSSHVPTFTSSSFWRPPYIPTFMPAFCGPLMYPPLWHHHSVVLSCTHLYGTIILWSSCTHLYNRIILWSSHVPIFMAPSFCGPLMYPPLWHHHSVVLSCTHLYGTIILWSSHVPIFMTPSFCGPLMYPPLWQHHSMVLPIYSPLCLHHSVVPSCTHLYGSIILWSSLYTHLYACIILWFSHIPTFMPASFCGPLMYSYCSTLRISTRPNALPKT